MNLMISIILWACISHAPLPKFLKLFFTEKVSGEDSAPGDLYEVPNENLADNTQRYTPPKRYQQMYNMANKKYFKGRKETESSQLKETEGSSITVSNPKPKKTQFMVATQKHVFFSEYEKNALVPITVAYNDVIGVVPSIKTTDFHSLEMPGEREIKLSYILINISVASPYLVNWAVNMSFPYPPGYNSGYIFEQFDCVDESIKEPFDCVESKNGKINKRMVDKSIYLYNVVNVTITNLTRNGCIFKSYQGCTVKAPRKSVQWLLITLIVQTQHERQYFQRIYEGVVVLPPLTPATLICAGMFVNTPRALCFLALDDCDRRMAFSEGMIQWHNEWPELVDNILWSDEAVFHVGGFVNKHNCHYWAQHNPKISLEKLTK